MSKMNPMMGGGDGGFGGIDFSKLGAAQSTGGMPDLGDLGGEEGGESSDDEDMPELEENDNAKPADAKPAEDAAVSKPKIEEVA
jgi:hypothetical protein